MSFKRCPNHYVSTTELQMETKLHLDPNPEGDETTYTVHLGGEEAKGTCMASESQGDLLKNKTVLFKTFLNSQLGVTGRSQERVWRDKSQVMSHSTRICIHCHAE